MYNSPVCYKHKGQKPSPKEYERASGEDLWWTDDDESQRCDDTPESAVCEFDTYDGICWNCKNMVHPDIHLIHLICNRRTGHGLLDPITSREDRAPELEDALDRILDPLEERDITSHPNLPPEDRVKALKEMDDREHILTELEASFPDWKERGLSQFNLEPDGFGLGEEIHRLYENIHFFNQKEWDPGWAAEWGLYQRPEVDLDLRYHRDASSASQAIGFFLLALYGWFVVDEGLLEVFAKYGQDKAGIEILCTVFLIPPYFIYNAFFIGSDNTEDD